jgi:hypothetical protein
MELTKGKIASAQKVLIYGPEGVGKSTLASKFPRPLFIDTEGSTKHLDVTRTIAPTSWAMLREQVLWVKTHTDDFRTLVIDTADWAEKLCIQYVCDTKDGGGKSGLEDFGYGKGYTYLAEEFGRLLNALSEIIEAGIHVVFTAHAAIKQTELPEETGKYEFWTLKLERKTAPLLKEWADLILFANYRTIVEQDPKTKTNKARGGQRYMYSTHRTTWDAKNRHDLPEEMTMDYANIAHIFDPVPPVYVEGPLIKEAPEPAKAEPAASAPDAPVRTDEDGVIIEDPPGPKKEEAPPAERPEKAPLQPDPEKPKDMRIIPVSQRPPWTAPPVPEGKEYLKALYDLMEQANITDIEIRRAVAERTWRTLQTLIENYPPDLIMNGLVGHWDKVRESVDRLREEELPF